MRSAADALLACCQGRICLLLACGLLSGGLRTPPPTPARGHAPLPLLESHQGQEVADVEEGYEDVARLKEEGDPGSPAAGYRQWGSRHLGGGPPRSIVEHSSSFSLGAGSGVRRWRWPTMEDVGVRGGGWDSAPRWR